MKKIISLFYFIFVFVTLCSAQSIFERIPNNGEKLSVLLLGCHGNDIKGFGSASLFFAPISTNKDAARIICAVTALHCLKDKETGEMFDSLYLKIGMPFGAKSRYVKVPLKHDEPKNYWVSPSGLDLVAIPLPPEVINGSDMGTLTEDEIITPAKIDEANIVPGLIAQVLCMQPEYWTYPVDYVRPETIPTIRTGHVSRLGFYKSSNGLQVRPHIVDVHSSPGNSGATVIVWVPSKDSGTAEAMFLGIVQGFYEENGDYLPYQIPITKGRDKEQNLELVSAQGTTNRMALAFKTVANPNLTDVIPVYELVDLRDSQQFISAVNWMGSNRPLYEISSMPITQTDKK